MQKQAYLCRRMQPLHRLWVQWLYVRIKRKKPFLCKQKNLQPMRSQYSLVSIRGFQPCDAGSNPADRIFLIQFDPIFQGRNPCKIMKHAKRKIALERIHVLINSAISNARLNPDLAQRQASLARRISTHYRIKMPYELRINFCKQCKNFIAPGINSRIRLGRTYLKSIRITCNFCEHTYRKVIAQ